MSGRSAAIWGGLLIGLACLLGVSGIADEETAENLSTGRTFGIGIQTNAPWGGLLSGRYWFPSGFGAEGVLFVWGDARGIEGSGSIRTLIRAVDAPVVDFYVALGATVPFSPYAGREAILSAVGGIEFGVRFARNLAWNIEFGVGYSTYRRIQMVLGGGIHFYF